MSLFCFAVTFHWKIISAHVKYQQIAEIHPEASQKTIFIHKKSSETPRISKFSPDISPISPVIGHLGSRRSYLPAMLPGAHAALEAGSPPPGRCHLAAIIDPVNIWPLKEPTVPPYPLVNVNSLLLKMVMYRGFCNVYHRVMTSLSVHGIPPKNPWL
jgi:hypothetical protein